MRCIEVDGGLDPLAIDEVQRLLEHPAAWKPAFDDNYEIGRRHFSYQVIRDRFLPLVAEVAAVVPA